MRSGVKGGGRGYGDDEGLGMMEERIMSLLKR
jgi:hypothetical protein